MMPAPYLACMALVSQVYALPPRVLPAVQAVEGGAPGVVHHNTDGSDDLGVMQVNTVWLPVLARQSGLETGEVRTRLLERPCFNVAAAGLILRTYLQETRGDLLRAVGNYHSHTPVLNRYYQARVMRSAMALFRPEGGQGAWAARSRPGRFRQGRLRPWRVGADGAGAPAEAGPHYWATEEQEGRFQEMRRRVLGHRAGW